MILWSPKADLLACQDSAESDDVHLVHSDGTLVRTIEMEGQVAGMAWSPDGSTLALTTESQEEPPQVVIVSLETGERAAYPCGAQRVPGYLAWSPDGRYLGYTSLGFDLTEQLTAALHIVDVDGRRSWALAQTDDIDGMSAWRPGSQLQ
jgi:dipeptidyl aminopeptidase/acylaminoacyl peptidase